MAGSFDKAIEGDTASGGVQARLRCIPTRLSQLLEGKGLTPPFGGIDQVEIVLRGDFTAGFPCRHCRVGLTNFFSQLSHSRPNVENVFHAKELRILRITVNTQIAECDPQLVYLGLPQP
jgi:hypothetical protein